jgi:iron(III) transport system substrate-binding protein
MKSFTTYSILFLFGIVMLFGCQSNKKEKLVVYSPHGKELLSDFEKRYEAIHPNVDIQWLDMGSQEVFDRISTESKNPQADIWWGAPSTMFSRAEKMNLLEKYIPSWAEQIPAVAKSKNGFWFGTFSTPEVIAFNSKKLNPSTAPKDWKDLTTPTWKNKVVLRNPMASGTLRAIFCAMIQQSIKKNGNESEGWDWLKKLNDNTESYAADPNQMYGKLGSDNAMVTLWNMPDIILQKNKNNFSFDYVFPSSGTVVLTDAIAIVKGSKHKQLAKDFYEFVTSQESLLIQAEKYYRIPSRMDLPKDKLPVWLRNCSYNTLDIDWELISTNEANWMKKWDAEIKSKN